MGDQGPTGEALIQLTNYLGKCGRHADGRCRNAVNAGRPDPSHAGIHERRPFVERVATFVNVDNRELDNSVDPCIQAAGLDVDDGEAWATARVIR